MNNTGWDSSFWAEPTLVVGEAGVSSGETQESRRTVQLGTVQLNGHPVRYEVVLGPRGLLDADVRVRFNDKEVSFRGFEITVLDSRIDRPPFGSGTG
jgi:hypothetical protein